MVPAVDNNPRVSASGIYSGSYPAWQAFDAVSSLRTTMWISEVWETPAWIAYDFGEPTVVDRYVITNTNGSSLVSRAPKDFTFEGWDGTGWVVLDTRTEEIHWTSGVDRTYDVAEPAAYSRYRVHITDDNDYRSGVVVISMGDLQFQQCSDTPPHLSLKPTTFVSGVQSSADMPMMLQPHHRTLTSVAFSVDYDETCLDFVGSDAVHLDLPAHVGHQVFFDAADTDGEIDIALFVDDPSTQTLPNGIFGHLIFAPTCVPERGEQIEAPVVFSADPEPSFGDQAADDVTGTWEGDRVLIVAGRPGDCNGNGVVSAADISACQLETLDDDGEGWLDAPGGTFAGHPAGCDSNGDTVIDAGDLSCKARLIFGQTCAPPATRRAFGTAPRLSLPTSLAMHGDAVAAKVFFDPGSASVNSVVFSLRYDPERFRFDGDVTFAGNQAGVQSVEWNAAFPDGAIRIAVADLDEGGLIDGGELLEIQLQPIGVTPIENVIGFAFEPVASFGDIWGQSVPGLVEIGDPVLFRDGFEDGDLRRWQTTP